jgi:septal ring factor EnvC (AmiA/AmiB activator)
MSGPSSFRPSRRRLAVAATVLASALAAGLTTGSSTSAQTAKLDEVRAQQDDLRGQLDEQNQAIDSLLGEVSALRVREDKVAGELAEQEAELAAARAELTDARETLIRIRHRLRGALDELEKLLVRIYRYGEPDEVTVLLNSDGLDELATTTTYFDRIRGYQSDVVGTVRTLRASQRESVEQIEASVERMEAARAAIAERQAALAESRASLEAREAELEAAQAARREQLEKLAGEEKDLLKALSTPPPTPEAAAESETAPAPAANVPAPTAPTASVNSDGTATAPADAPQAVKDVIAAGNQITNMPYLYGGGHGSFEASGYDCSGSVSYALHGGGFLSTPLDSTGFMTWGESGPGQWITVYSNPGHAYMVVAGLRFDTSGAPPRWQAESRDPAGYVATHPPGY